MPIQKYESSINRDLSLGNIDFFENSIEKQPKYRLPKFDYE